MTILANNHRRIIWADLAKGYGMLLVFAGHFIESLYWVGHPNAFEQFKWIYSFHMPFFFVLAGYLNGGRKAQDWRGFVRRKISNRLVPFLFFNILALAFWIPSDITGHTASLKGILVGFAKLLAGRPSFNLVTWFLACLLTVEILHYFIGGWLKNNFQLAVSSLLFLIGGWWLTWMIGAAPAVYQPIASVWYLFEAFVAYAFFQMGLLLRHSQALSSIEERHLPKIGLLGLAVLFFGLVSLTFDWNTGPSRLQPFALLMVASSHGNLLLFPLTALFGFFFLVFLSQTTPANRALLFVGRNSLALLGLNGIFYHFLNLPIASRLNTWIPPSPWALGLAALTVSLLSIAACAPVILLLNARFPLLVGKRPSQPSLASLAGEEVSLTDF